jgi:hypothetical protein
MYLWLNAGVRKKIEEIPVEMIAATAARTSCLVLGQSDYEVMWVDRRQKAVGRR